MRRGAWTTTHALIAGCAFVSGATALSYEIVWLRDWSLAFGNDTYAQGVVLAILMLGMATGSLVCGRVAHRCRRPLMWYGVCEIGVAAAALAARAIAARSTPLLAHFYDAGAGVSGILIALRAAVAAVALLPPTILMGSTIPLLVWSLRRLALARGFAWVYAANTLGAGLGCALTGYAAIGHLGLTGCTSAAIFLSVAVGGVAIRLGASRGGAAATPEGASPACVEAVRGNRGKWVLALAACASGALLMTQEVAWTRIVALTIGGSTYSYTTVLVAILVGLGCGNLLAARRVNKGADPTSALPMLFVLHGVATALSFALAGVLPLILIAARPLIGDSAAATQLAGACLSLILCGGPTIVAGMILPITCQHLARDGRLFRGIVVPYAMSSVGGMVGPALAATYLIPRLGMEWVLRASGMGAVLVGVGTLWAIGIRRGRIPRTALAIAVLGVTAMMPEWDPAVVSAGAYAYARPLLRTYGDRDADSVQDVVRRPQVLYNRDGACATVAVFRDPGGITYLRTNGKTDASNGVDMPTQILCGALPALLQETVDRVCVIGCGSGVSAAVARAMGAKRVDCVEIERAVIDALPCFVAENGGVAHDEAVHMIVGDGRSHLEMSREQYDAIVSVPSNPWLAGIGSLYTRECYETCKRRLAPGGVLCQWVQIYEMDVSDYVMVLRTIATVFPHVALCRAGLGDTIVIASREPIVFRAEVLSRIPRNAGKGRWSRWVDLTKAPAVLKGMWCLGEREVREWTELGKDVNTDDRPLLEYRAPLALGRLRDRGVEREIYRRYRTPLPGEIIEVGAFEDRQGAWRRATLALAGRLVDAGNGSAAEAEVRGLMEEGVVDGEVHFALAEILFRRGASQEARAELQEAADLDPRWLNQRAVHLFGTGDHAGAIEALSELLRKAPGSVTALGNMAVNRREVGDVEGSRTAFARALELDPAAEWVRAEEGDAETH